MEKNIYVDYDAVTDKLILSDNGQTNASKSDVIHWKPKGKVCEILEVVEKADSPVSTGDFWKDAPQSNGVNFKGKIKDDLIGENIWEYDITGNIGTKKDPIRKIEDPRIQVDSRDDEVLR